MTARATLLVVSAAGRFDPQKVRVQWATDEQAAAGKRSGSTGFADVGAAPAWRNLRAPLSAIPDTATQIRLVADGDDLAPQHWIALTPAADSTAAHTAGRGGLQGSGVPGLAGRAGIPMPATVRPSNGVIETPKWRILPDRFGAEANSPVMDENGGGPLGITDQLLLQVQPDQAVFHGAAGVAHRDGHLRHPRLRNRPASHRRKPKSPLGGGDEANQRLCDAQAADARPAPDVAIFIEVTRPSDSDGQHAPALRFGEPPVMAVVVGFTHLLAGFDNPALVRVVSALLGCPYTSRQATYDLRRLKRKGLIVRLPGHHRYQLTALGRRVAVLFTKVYGRVLAPGLAELDPRLPTDLATRSALAQAWRQLDRSLNQFTNAAFTAA
ncbi:arabinosyltransferase C-terminal domain-containing protein [Mycobacterium pseudokansasii]|uniref:arabinosyltransferase C-terminal domain-containing protein n=1 Tax=Mycobacterium pseudokansasii TaxID=2341080 RepID=UPI003CC7DB48